MTLNFLTSRLGQQRGLLVLAIFYYLLLGFIIQVSVPAFSHVCTYRDILGILALGLLFLSFIRYFKSYVLKGLYLIYVLSIGWVFHVLYESQLAPENGLVLLVFFILVGIGITQVQIFRWYVALFSLSLFVVVFSIKDPLTPSWLFAGLYLLSATITYLLIVNFKKIQAALRVSIGNMRLLLDQVDECFILIDSEFKVLQFNRKAFDTFLTYQNKKLKEGADFYNFMDESGEGVLQEALENANHGRSAHFDHNAVYEVKGASIVKWYEIKMFPVIKDNVTVNIVFTALDITDRYESSEKLIRSEQMFKNLFRKAPIGMALADKKGEIIAANHAYCQTVGYPIEEVLYRSFKDYTHPDDLDYNYDLLQKLLQREISEYQIEKRYIQKNGKTIYVIVRVIVLKDLEGKDQILAQVIDVTRLKKVEEILKTKNNELQNTNADLANMNLELEKTNMELDRFIYSASHDLRAPLSTLLGLINLAKIEVGDGNDLYMNLMEKSVNKLDTFIGEIIQYSTNARTELSEEHVGDLGNLIEEIIDNLKISQALEDIDFRILYENVPGFVADKQRLQIVLENLISNAIKYHDENKRNKCITVKAALNENVLALQVQDNGIGIPEKYKHRIFDFFFKAHERSFGAGLGLYIVKQTTSKMGGTIAFDSKVGEGSTFIISIPVVSNINSRSVA